MQKHDLATSTAQLTSDPAMTRIELYRCACRQQHGRLAKGCPHAEGVHLRFDVLHGVIDRKGFRLIAQLVPSFLHIHLHSLSCCSSLFHRHFRDNCLLCYRFQRCPF